MALDRGTSRRPAADGHEAGKANGEEGEEDDVARRLRVLGSVCAALMVAVLATVAAIGWAAAGPGAGDLMASPPVDSFLIAFGAMLLVLLASAVHGRILRRQAAAELEEPEEAEEPEAQGKLAAVKGEPEELEEPEEEAPEELAAETEKPEEQQEPPERWRQPVAPAAAMLRAYSWATGASFGMLAAAAALGAVVASTGKAPFYGLVICIAACFSMVARWPRRSGFDLALQSDRRDAVSRAAAWRNLAQPFVSHTADRAEEDASGGPAAGSDTNTTSATAAARGASGDSEAKVGAEASGAAHGGIGSRPG